MCNNLLRNIVVPDFSNYLRTPNEKACKVIDSTRLIVEVLGGLNLAQEELGEDESTQKVLIDGEYSLLIRYRREKTGKYIPACILSFDYFDEKGIIVNQLQGVRDKHISYRFDASFKTEQFFIDLIEETFSKRGVIVNVVSVPEGVEGVSKNSRVNQRYDKLSRGVESLNKKYGLS